MASITQTTTAATPPSTGAQPWNKLNELPELYWSMKSSFQTTWMLPWDSRETAQDFVS